MSWLQPLRCNTSFLSLWWTRLGTASASFQIEGAANTGRHTPSIWDEFSRIPGKIANGRDDDVACDSYHLWREDVALLKRYGMPAYRFSISWSRVVPDGGRDDAVKEKGIAYYSNLIDALLEAGIEPYIDLPQKLHVKYGGWLNKGEIVKDFAKYANAFITLLLRVARIDLKIE